MEECKTWTDFFGMVCKMGNLYTLIVISAIVLAVCLWCVNRRFVQRKVSSSMLLVLSTLVFVAGLAVYTIGAMQADPDVSIFDALYAVPTAIISSLGMFFYQDDISELTDAAKDNSIFMACYALVHFFAAIIMAFVILRLLGMRLEYWWRMRKCGRKCDRLYIFWGISPQALALGKSISEKESKLDIVFVNTVEDETEDNSVHRLLDIIKIKVSTDDKICDMGATLTNCYEDISDSSVSEGQTLDGMVRRKAKLKSLADGIARAKEIHLFFLSNDEERNINSASNAIKAIEGEHSDRLKDTKVHIYCHAHNSAKTQGLALHDILEYGKEPSVHVIDSSALAIYNLKNNVDDCPVSLVDIDQETATVKSGFRAIIIGYGETGEETLKFLYEFGAFVGKDGRKKPFHCTVIDREATKLEGDFYAKSPALKNNSDTSKLLKNGNEISFEECEIGSNAYWDIIAREVKLGVCYIMVSINNDDLGLATAMKLREKCFYLQEGNEQPLKIYLRCARQENFERFCSNVEDKNVRYDNISLKVFGSINEVFNYETIIDDINIRRAKIYNWEYAGHKVSDKTMALAKELTVNLMELCWIDQLKLMRLKDNKLICDIDDSMRRRDQNISNSLHSKTKMYILEKAGMGKDYWKGKTFDRTENTPNYGDSLSDKEKLVLANIARLEHERWIAASLLQGWEVTKTATEDKNTRTKRHNDIRPWDELRSEGKERLKAQGYDCDVVETTIRQA